MARKGERLLPQKFGAGLARGFFLGGALRPVINHYVHPEVTGLENLADLSPPLILAANHSSHMDTPLIVNSLPKELRHRTLVAAASDYFFSSRMLGLFVSLAVGAVPMDRRVASRQTMDKVDDLLEQKWCLVIYPEGSRTIDGRLYRGKTGIARLALSAHAPIVPVGIVGTYNAMPAGRSWPVPHRVQVHFGKPLTFDRYRLGVADQLVLRAITDQVMYEIMMLTGQTYVDEYVSRAKARQVKAEGGPDRKPDVEPGPDAPDEGEEPADDASSDLAAGLLSRGEDQVFPVHDGGCGAVIVAAGEVGEFLVKRGGAGRVGGDVPVGGDGGPVAALEVIPEVLGPGEQADADGLAPGRHVADPIAEQCADVIFAAPPWRWLRARRGRRGVRFHDREHLADEAFRSPVEQADGAARAAYPD
jgi:1-acyl-sn-glycerol-3-phosphate acyltransferase